MTYFHCSFKRKVRPRSVNHIPIGFVAYSVYLLFASSIFLCLLSLSLSSHISALLLVSFSSAAHVSPAATMGTLTADLPRLPEYCDHKLPTSCRLSSIPNCCACADERPHQSSYSTYVDGVGFVARGARWDRYCWPCSRIVFTPNLISHPTDFT